MFHSTLTRKSSSQHRSGRVFRTMALVATVMAGSLWAAQASADITVIYSSDSYDRYDRYDRHDRYNRHDRYDRHGRYDGVGLIGSLLMPGSVRYHDNHRGRHDRHFNHGRSHKPRHPHAGHSRRPDFANGNRGRWQSNRHREIIYVDKDARHRGNYRDVERRSVIIRRRD